MGKSKKFTFKMAPDPDYITGKLYHIFKIQFKLYYLVSMSTLTWRMGIKDLLYVLLKK